MKYPTSSSSEQIEQPYLVGSSRHTRRRQMNVDIEPSDQYSDNYIIAPNLKIMLLKFQENSPRTFIESRASGYRVGSEPGNTRLFWERALSTRKCFPRKNSHCCKPETEIIVLGNHSMVFRSRAKAFFVGFGSPSTFYPLSRPFMKLSGPTSWISITLFSDLMLQ